MREASKPFGLVSGQGQAAMGEEVFESTGERSHRPFWLPGPFQQGLGRVGVLVLHEAAEVRDEAAGPGDAEAGRDMTDEVVQPRGRTGELVAEVFAADEGTAGVFLPAD